MSEKTCGPCSRQDKLEVVVSWCVQCQDLLCNACSEYHRVLKITTDHRLITFDEYISVSELLTTVSACCEKHGGNPLEYFCTTHKVFCCLQCKKQDHYKCPETTIVNELECYGNEDESNDLLLKVKKTINILENACEKLSKNIKTLNICREEFTELVKQKKTQVQKLLTDLDTKLKQFNEDYHIKRLEMQNQKDEFTRILDEFKERQEKLHLLQKVKSFSKIHFFLIERQLKQENEKDEFQPTFSDLQFEFNIAFKLNEQQQTIEVLDNVSFKISHCQVEPSSFDRDSSTVEADDIVQKQNNTLQINKNNFAITTSLSSKTSEKLSNKKTFSFKMKTFFRVEKKNPHVAIRCVEVLKDEHVIIGEGSDPRLLIYAKKGYRKDEIKLKQQPKAITLVDQNTVAVTCGQSVLIVDVKNLNAMRISKRISLSDNCYGITYSDKNLVVNCENDGLKLMTLDGCIVHTHSSVKGVLDIIYIGKDKNVVCVKKDSDVVEFFNLSTANLKSSVCPNLSGASGIAIDREGNYLVTCDQTDQVYILKKSNSRWSELSKEHNINKPWGIAYDSNRDEMIIINNGGKFVCTYEKISS